MTTQAKNNQANQTNGPVMRGKKSAEIRTKTRERVQRQPIQTDAERDAKSSQSTLTLPVANHTTLRPAAPLTTTITPIIQPKLEVNDPNDRYEVEADRVADQVMRMSAGNLSTQPTNGWNRHATIAPKLQLKCAACGSEDETAMRSHHVESAAPQVTPTIERNIHRMQGGGKPLDDNTRTFFEQRIGADFSGVRIHTDTNAIQTSRDINARAFTTGNNIAFNSGEYNPTTTSGKHLLAHELTHTIQQNGAQTLQRQEPETNDAPSSDSSIVQNLVSDNQTLSEERIPITPDLLEILEPVSKSNPKFSKKHRNLTHTEIQGEPFVRGQGDKDEVDPHDVRQGQLGDCYLLSALSAIASSNPSILKNLIKDNGDGTYDVTLYIEEGMLWWKKRSPTVIKVDSKFATDKSGNPQYAQPGDQGPNGPELWVMLIEKAYAKHKGSYEKIAGGYPGEAMEMLSNKESSNHRTRSLKDDDLITKLDKALSEGQALTASTRQLKGKKAQAANQVGVYGLHAYRIESVDVANKTIDLQNPWGSQHVKGLSIADFKKYYSSFDILAK